MNTEINLESFVFEQEGIALDIDETLSNTVDDWVRHLQKNFGNHENLSPADLISKYTYTQNVPYWQSKEALAYIEMLRNSNKFNTSFQIMPGADEKVNKIHREIIPIVAYITIRPSSVKEGTKEWLAKKNFPEAHLIFKPDSVPLADGIKWKARTLELLYPKVRGIIDDNLSLPKLLSPSYKGNIFVLSEQQFANPNNIQAIGCKDWNAAYEAVLKAFRI